MGEFSSFALVPEQGVVPELSQLPGDMRARIGAMAARLDLRDAAAVREGSFPDAEHAYA